MAKPEITNLHILGYFNERLTDVTKLDEFLTVQEPTDIVNDHLSKKSLKRKLALISGKKRTSSYMRYKLPRLKCKRKADNKKGGELKCRRERRNRSLLNQLHSIHTLEAESSTEHSSIGTCQSPKKAIPRWLETHFWHKKRFHTKLCWGYTLPIHHKARGKKFLHEAVKTSAVIHDSSYIRPIQIIGERQAVRDLLRQFTVS